MNIKKFSFSIVKFIKKKSFISKHLSFISHTHTSTNSVDRHLLRESVELIRFWSLWLSNQTETSSFYWNARRNNIDMIFQSSWQKLELLNDKKFDDEWIQHTWKWMFVLVYMGWLFILIAHVIPVLDVNELTITVRCFLVEFVLLLIHVEYTVCDQKQCKFRHVGMLSDINNRWLKRRRR